MSDKCDIDGKPIQMIASTSCPHCSDAKEMLGDRIARGRIEVIDETNPLFEEIATKYNIKAVPTFVKDGVCCDLNKDDSGLFLNCDGKRRELDGSC